MNDRLCYGKAPASYDRRDLLYAHLRDPAIPVRVPPTFGRTPLVTVPWQMLGNDRWGDCVLAGAAHETMLFGVEGAAAAVPPFDEACVLADYAAITGFTPDAGPPGANPTDAGTPARTALDYRRQTGIIDANGNRHKIAAYVALEPGNFDELLEACYVFTAVGVGFAMPDYAQDEFFAGQPWAYRGPGSQDGGHYVPVTGHPAAGIVKCVTWGRTQLITRRFYQTFCDEAYAILSLEALRTGRLGGFGLAELEQILGGLPS